MIIWKAVSLVGLALCALGHKDATSEQKLKQTFHLEQLGHHGELEHIGAHKPGHHEEYAWAYPSYEFSYQVNDPHTHDHKGQHESREGDEVKGEYWLVQPDGKKRTVKYHSDKHAGFKAHVHYSDHHDHHAEPHKEEIIIPVEEIMNEEPLKQEEEKEPIIEEVPEIIVQEERQEEREEEREEERNDGPEQKHIELKKHHWPTHVEEPKEKHIVLKKHHGPVHIEYYILHKYHKKHHGEHEEFHEHREEENAKQENSEEKHEEKHLKPIHTEYYSKIQHHHDHHLPIVHYKPLLHHEHIEEHHEEINPVHVEEVHAERKHHVEHPPHIPLLRLHRPKLSYHDHHDFRHRHQRDYKERKVAVYKRNQ